MTDEALVEKARELAQLAGRGSDSLVEAFVEVLSEVQSEEREANAKMLEEIAAEFRSQGRAGRIQAKILEIASATIRLRASNQGKGELSQADKDWLKELERRGFE